MKPAQGLNPDSESGLKDPSDRASHIHLWANSRVPHLHDGSVDEAQQLSQLLPAGPAERLAVRSFQGLRPGRLQLATRIGGRGTLGALSFGKVSALE